MSFNYKETRCGPLATIKKKHSYLIENEMTHIENVSMGAHLNNNKFPKCLRMVSTWTCILLSCTLGNCAYLDTCSL